MDNIPKTMVSLVLIMLCLIIGVALVFTHIKIDQARSYHDQVIKIISSTDIPDAKIQDCIADASSKDYVLVVTTNPIGHNQYVYRVDLTYSVTAPLFGKWTEKRITGYAINYLALAEADGVEP